MIVSTSARRFTQRERQWIVDRLNEVGATRPCPRCGHSEFSLLPVAGEIVVDANKGLFPANESIKYAVCACTKCGFLSHHALAVLGTLPAPQWGEI